MHGPAAAEGDQSKIADIITARGRHGFDRFFHFGVDDFEHPVGGFEQIEL